MGDQTQAGRAAPFNSAGFSAELEHIEQDERVYMSQEGDLYFANVEERDSRSDYCCFAAFPKLRTIVQKMPMKLTVNSCKSRELAVLSQCRMQPCLYHPGANAGRS